MGDLDGLKKINDEYGHIQGDHAIVHIANILRQTFRRSDITARFAGDEFSIAALDAREGSENLMLKRLQTNLARHNDLKISPYSLRISIGYSIFNPAAPETLEKVLMKADRSLYQNKKGQQPVS